MSNTSSPPPADDSAVRGWLSVVRAYHLCSELLGARLAELGVRTTEHEILLNLRRSPGLSQQALARQCFTAKSHVSGVLDEMHAKGWITRSPDPSDRRVKRLTLTPAGTELASRTFAVQAEVVALMTDELGQSQINLVTQIMSEVSDRLEAALAAKHGSV